MGWDVLQTLQQQEQMSIWQKSRTMVLNLVTQTPKNSIDGFMESTKYSQYFEFKCIFLVRDCLFKGMCFKKVRLTRMDGS